MIVNRISAILKCALTMLITSACSSESPQQQATKERFCLDASLVNAREHYRVTDQPVAQTLNLTGKVEYNADKVVHFVSLVEGVTTNIHFSLGDKVSKGQLLAEIRSTELSGLESQRKSLESQLRVAERQLQSVESMHDGGIASQKDLLEAQSSVHVIKAELERIHLNLSLYSVSPDGAVFQIRAPSSGFVVHKNIAPGMPISAGGDALFTISDLSEVWISISVYAGDVMQVKQGMEVTITTMSYPGESFTGKIKNLPQVFDSEERVLKARVHMENTDMKLKPGMLVDVSITRQDDQTAMLVPARALIFDNNRNFVVLSKGECDVEIREVDVVAKNNGVIFLAGGVSPGDSIITSNHLLVYERIKNGRQ